MYRQVRILLCIVAARHHQNSHSVLALRLPSESDDVGVAFSDSVGPSKPEEPEEIKRQHLLYYINMPSNTKHSESFYAAGLNDECKVFQNLVGHDAIVHIVGSAQWVRAQAPACTGFIPPELNVDEEDSVSNLLFGDVVGLLWSNCSLKWDQRERADGFPGFQTLAKIWLNKLPMLCKAAGRYPDAVTVMPDSGLIYKSKAVWDEALKAFTQLRPDRLGMPHYPVPAEAESRRWFGQPTCRTVPQLTAQFLAVRGRDCPQILEAYRQALLRVQSDSTCGCFDEEIVFTRMLADSPELIDTQWIGSVR